MHCVTSLPVCCAISLLICFVLFFCLLFLNLVLVFAVILKSAILCDYQENRASLLSERDEGIFGSCRIGI